MFTSLLLTTGLAAGQPPAPGYTPPSPVYYGQTPVLVRPPGAGLPAPWPAAQPPAGGQPVSMPMTGQPMPMPSGMKTGDDKQNSEEKKDDEKKDDGKKDEPQKYLLERTLAQTRLGEIMGQRNITVYGWTEMSYNVSTASRSNAPVFMIDRANDFLLNQNYLVLERTLDTSKKEFQWGWRTDWVLPGSDARTSVVRGLWFGQLQRGDLYPIDLFQAYGQAYLPGLGGEGTTVKVGRFATHLEYELFQAVDTPFVTRSYLFQYNPFTHTGVWAVTQLDDTWSVGNGLVLGNDTWFNAPTNRPTYLGQVKWAPKDGNTQVLFNCTVTNPKYSTAEAFAFYNVYNVQVIHKFNDKFSYVLDTAFSHIDNVPDIGSTNWYGAVNYFIYNHTDKLTSTLRAEVFEDTSGFRTGFKGLYTEVTYGVAWKLRPGLIIRPSVRYDNNSQSPAFEGNQNLFTSAMDVIIRW